MGKAARSILVFDLDETLVHATKNKFDRQEDFTYEEYYVYKRPWVDAFLLECHRFCSIAIWSSADDEYVKAIVKQLLPKEIRPRFVWGRSECWMKIVKVEDPETGLKMKEYQHIKPLEKICRMGYDMQHLLIIDDSHYKVKDNVGCHLIIKAFEGDDTDKELTTLLHALKEQFLKMS